MNKYQQLRRRAQTKWEALKSSPIPVIYLGMASCGRAAGALEVMQTIQETLEKNRLRANIVSVGCIGPCHLEPIMDITMPGKTRLSYGNVTPQKARTIIESYLIEGDPVKKLALGFILENTQISDHIHGKELENEPDDGILNFYSHPMLKSQIRVVLRNCGLIDPEDIDHYLANDGYLGLMKAFENGVEWVLNEVRDAGLRGRGGAGFATYKKWEICRAQSGKTKYVICNADEGDPGAFMNRSLIEGDPHAVLEGLLIAGYALSASHGYVYIRAEYPLAVERLRKAIEQMRQYGFLGRNIRKARELTFVGRKLH
jgi:(2Fe-2S) ferredoxin